MPKVKRLESVTEMICSAMLRLVERGTAYDEITVQMLVDEAKVCRNSFYRNFRTIDDVFRKGFEEICRKTSSEKDEDGDYDFFSIFRSVCRIFREHDSFFRTYYTAAPGDYYDTITRHVMESNARGKEADVTPGDHYTYACRTWLSVGVITDWMMRDYDISIEELTDIVRRHEL